MIRALDRAVAVALLAVMLLAALALGYALFHAGSGALTMKKAAVAYLLPGLVLAGSTLALFLSRQARRLVGLYGLCAVLAVYGAQAYLQPSGAPAESGPALLGQKLGLPVDPRTKRAVIEDFRKQGIDAWPAVVTTKFLTEPIKHDGKETLPLSGISKVVSVNCNEFGSWMIYPADEHGFNNPLGLWKAPVRTLAIGDSFVHGACEPPGKDLVSVLREAEPSALNLGIGGRGPLMELATFVEYAPALRPATTLWFYYDGNDLSNLADERNHDMLMRYLREDFHQNLIERQDEIDRLLKDVVNKASSDDLRKSGAVSLADFLLLRPLRAKFALNVTGTIENLETTQDYLALIPLFKETMTKAARLAAGWQGKIVFVYLPSMEMLTDPKHVDTRQAVLTAARESGVDILDLTAAFEAEKDAVKRFWYAPNTHYSAEGYRFVAKNVLLALKRDVE